MRKKRILAIDFDGTITTGPYPAIGGLNKGAKLYINKLYAEGYYIIINTCRSGERLKEAKTFLDAQGIAYHLINENDPDNIKRYGQDTRKIFAHLYIDDKNLQGFPGWRRAYRIIRRKLPPKYL